ncbi:bifunctional hydroxymethylpyrimidine kinase/phosphomethylpyrimidine kinase [Cumulibacter manganitolerans]|uniref:bifunctional hydroxymethylpyrimidine kinase/phosphomethylpyrimidine kinase n=1 Tax=Cumulibacter manganitolerans TaxID=1884992 RepID=UPI001297FD56|nr:bifunctional hydroxymethylpyrimidine kinase/phosphomethylpyrimidine kinase [Cumulibacter manganitolerans]
MPDPKRHPTRPPVALSIAGSDPSGGAGIQADLKTFSALGTYGTCVITALTAQSTRTVTMVHPIPVPVVREQLTTLVEDVRIDVVKVGMLGSAELIEMIHDVLTDGPLRTTPVVLDPVMVSSVGTPLLAADALAALRALVSRVDVVTPNLPEAAVLLDEPAAASVSEMQRQAERLVGAGASRVLLKGGHLEGERSVDVWLDSSGGAVTRLSAPRVATRDTHGTGCTLSSAVAAFYPRRGDWLPAVRAAKEWLTGALRHGPVLDIGHGPGPVHHFYEQTRWHEEPAP